MRATLATVVRRTRNFDLLTGFAPLSAEALGLTRVKVRRRGTIGTDGAVGLTRGARRPGRELRRTWDDRAVLDGNGDAGFVPATEWPGEVDWSNAWQRGLGAIA
jgi:hypothetical protein